MKKKKKEVKLTFGQLAKTQVEPERQELGPDELGPLHQQADEERRVGQVGCHVLQDGASMILVGREVEKANVVFVVEKQQLLLLLLAIAV